MKELGRHRLEREVARQRDQHGELLLELGPDGLLADAAQLCPREGVADAAACAGTDEQPVE